MVAVSARIEKLSSANYDLLNRWRGGIHFSEIANNGR
jgi:hypothetical protein